MMAARRRYLIGTAHYANNVDIMARAAEVLGKTVDAKKYRELHGRIVEAFRNRFVTPDGLVCREHADLRRAGVAFRLDRAGGPRDRDPRTGAKHRAQRHAPGHGFVGTPYLLHVLEAQGRLDVAYKLLEQETFPSWSFPVKTGDHDLGTLGRLDS